MNEYFPKSDGPQGKALVGRFAPFAEEVGLAQDRLPDLASRAKPGALVGVALEQHRARLVRELGESGASLVVTLGNEAVSVLAGLADSHDLPDRLTPTGDYGQRCSATVAGRPVPWSP